MIGCMSESSISISAGASISGQIDHIDLDSHYNLDPDPASGASMINGITMPSNSPWTWSIFKNVTFMLREHHKVAIYLEGHFSTDYGKMGIGVLRYLPNSYCSCY